MKTPYKLISSLALALLSLTSCEKDVMTQLPVERTEINDIFNPKDKEGTYIDEYVSSIYTQLPRGFNRIDQNYLDGGTDDAVTANVSTVPVDKFKTGQWGPSDLPENPWASNYAAIRRVNILLANIGNSGISEARKNSYRAQARFLRAMFYFEMLKRWGGIPLIGDKVFTLDDDVALKRNTLDESVAYILGECNALISDNILPATLTDAEIGRACKGAVLALKSRLLLYNASPLYNPAGDVARWQAAATAANDLIQTNLYSLEANFGTMFTTRKNKEFIFAYQQGDNATIENLNEPPGFQRTGQGVTNPTQDLVDAFPMKNGKLINEAGSGYIATNPYVNRDNRFALTIFHNGFSWLSTPLELFVGGKNNLKPGRASGTKTGYYLRKFMAVSGTAAAYANATHNFPIFRYAETLLNYAEAQNEALATPDASVYTAINTVRTRAGITPVIANGSLTKTQMRDLIRNERRVELAFEEHRFWDIRRWKIAETVLNGQLKGMQITKSGTTLTYQVVPVQTVFFDAARMYWYPISFTDISKNPNLKQNQGW
ncbi:Starch-binding associating with outer membrane [Flavobacterium fluvii]|uniref:Starch-binding associating with outer membrane n=1 Tax=Flavobacterium fluvii TaxID=468056 RepID=A0A1M5JUF1_9FLAO|nr:RagB/SusD family nutrient uptake outer membrane protein [Flavobacterium fluvii]SHG44197.1 Starch-binding associating with outer membrane [Flavobacterium fluvii]